jgi:deferrochelatase/peroxidase EfeB
LISSDIAMPPNVDPNNIQSIVLRSHPCEHSRHLLFRCNDKDGSRQFLSEWLPRITHGGIGIDPANPPCPMINIAVSWPGLDKVGAFDGLGGASEAAKVFPEDFMDPPDAELMRTYGPSAPENWWNKRFKTQDIDLTVHIYCMSRQQLDDASGEVRDSARHHGLDELIPTKDADGITGQVLGAGIPGLRRLHFGYSDGFSQPRIDDPAFAPGNSKKLYSRGRFVIDKWNTDEESFPRPEPWRGLVHHGSYLAFAWIHQDVAGFNRFLRDNAPKIARPGMSQEEAEEFLAAKMMGRWRDGTPLVLSPNRPDAQLAPHDFDYSSDADGRRCPVAAHIRITNGRDRPLNSANSVMFPEPWGFPRVLRRGSTYGPWLDGTEDDGLDRGIVGMFFCANINMQFYPLTRWIGTTNFSDDYADPTGQDPLFGNRDYPNASHSFTIPTEQDPVTLDGLTNFIRYQGVAILLMPSLATLRQLSATSG